MSVEFGTILPIQCLLWLASMAVLHALLHNQLWFEFAGLLTMMPSKVDGGFIISNLVLL